MKKSILLTLCSILSLFAITACSDKKNTISVCASLSPHAEILNEVVKPLIEKKGYTLEVTVLDWTLQNEAVYNSDYDANYFQHRPYLQQFDSSVATYSESYTYTKVFPVCGVHFEPLRIYEGKSKAADFESKKKTATYEICSDPSNEIRALDLLKSANVIDSYSVDENGNPIDDKLPKNITPINEELLVAQKDDYDYAVLPCNTALTGNVKVSQTLPTETDDVKDLRTNVIAANVKKYSENTEYKTKIDVLVDCILDESVSTFINKRYNNVISVSLKDYRK